MEIITIFVSTLSPAELAHLPEQTAEQKADFEAYKARINAPLKPVSVGRKSYEQRVAEMNAEHAEAVAKMFVNHPPELTPGTPEWNASFKAFDKRWEERYADPTSIFYKGPKA